MARIIRASTVFPAFVLSRAHSIASMCVTNVAGAQERPATQTKCPLHVQRCETALRRKKSFVESITNEDPYLPDPVKGTFNQYHD